MQKIIEIRVALKPVDDIDDPPTLKARLGCIIDVLKQFKEQLEAEIKAGQMIVGFGPVKEK